MCVESGFFTADDLHYLSFAKDVLFTFLWGRMRNNFVYVPCHCCYLSIHQSVSVAERWGHLFPVITSLLAPFTFVHCLQSIRWLLVHKVRGGVEEQAKGVCRKKLNQGVASIWAALSGGDARVVETGSKAGNKIFMKEILFSSESMQMKNSPTHDDA